MSGLLRLLPFLRPYARRLVAALACLLAVTGLSLAIPDIIRAVIDLGLTRGDVGFMALAGLAIIGVGAARAAFNLGQRYLAESTSLYVAYDLRNVLYDRIQRLPFAYHDYAQTGQLMSRFIEDIASVQRFLGAGLVDLVNALALLIGIVAVLLSLDARLAGLVLLPIAFLMAFTVRFGARIQPFFVRVQNALGRLSAALQESLTGIQVVKAFAREPEEIAKFGRANRELYWRRIEVNEVWAAAMPFMTFIIGIGVALVLYFGGQAVIAGALSLGGLVAFNSYLLMLGMPVQRLGWVVNALGEAAAGAQRLLDVLDVEPAIHDPPDAVVLGPLAGRVEFDDVSFAYGGSAPERNTLRGVSFVAEPNQVVALLGLTGSGKTTVVNLIPRFHDAVGGRVLVDGVDVRAAQLKSLRSQIGIVLQETLLFSATVRANIAYGRPDAAQDEIEAAARAARAHEFILELPDGYDTVVGERGVTLSGGQQQRIAIARALLLDPRILILDDSTSSVDVQTEYLIQEALAVLMRGRTTFVIAQRLSTVRRADRIIVLQDGRVVQQGTHDALLAEGGLYQEIYDLQLKDQERYRREMTFLAEAVWADRAAGRVEEEPESASALVDRTEAESRAQGG